MGRITIPLLAAAIFLALSAGDAFASATLSVNVAGSGSGEVSSSSGLVETQEIKEGEARPPIHRYGPPKTGTCESMMEDNYTVLYAFPDPNSVFAGWIIDEGEGPFWCGTEKEERGLFACLIFAAGESAKITAVFSPYQIIIFDPSLVVHIEEGSGTVVSNPAGLECTGSAPKACEGGVEGKVTLTASPAPGYAFKSWKGCDVGGVNGRQCTVITELGRTVGAKFVKVFNLEGTKSGGLGIFGTAPGGIVCGYACTSSTALYKEGAVTVKAKPARHFEFVEFKGGTGSASSCNGVKTLECTIATFNSNSTIEEVYAEEKKNMLSVSKEGGGQGFVTTTPANISCGYTCTAAAAQFYASESAAITVTLNKGTTSVTWTSGAGTCTGNALTCSVPMSSSHVLVAKFE